MMIRDESAIEYSDEELLDQLRRCYDKHGKVTPTVFNEDDDFCASSTVNKRFESWASAKERAGITEDDESWHGKQYSDDDVLDDIRECYDRHGKVTTSLMEEADDLVGPTTAVDRFGSWLDAKEVAGVGGDAREHNSRPREYSTAEMITMIQMAADDADGPLTEQVFAEYDDYPAPGTVRKRFGSWGQAKTEAGVE